MAFSVIVFSPFVSYIFFLSCHFYFSVTKTHRELSKSLNSSCVCVNKQHFNVSYCLNAWFVSVHNFSRIICDEQGEANFFRVRCFRLKTFSDLVIPSFACSFLYKNMKYILAFFNPVNDDLLIFAVQIAIKVQYCGNAIFFSHLSISVVCSCHTVPAAKELSRLMKPDPELAGSSPTLILVIQNIEGSLCDREVACLALYVHTNGLKPHSVTVYIVIAPGF